MNSQEFFALDRLCLDISTINFVQEMRCFDTVTSTNDRARQMLQSTEINSDALLLAGGQTAGRGRRGHTWASLPGGLWFSLAKRTNADIKRIPLVTLAMGLAVAQALDQSLPGPAGLKWPNDVHYMGKKLCGILTEVFESPENGRWLIIGIGINVNNSLAEHDELGKVATSLKDIDGEERSLEAVLFEVLKSAAHYYQLFVERQDDRIIDEYRARCTHLGQSLKVRSEREEIYGVCLDIAPDGSLLVRTEDDVVHTVTSADIETA